MNGLPSWAGEIVDPGATPVVRDGILCTLLPEGDDGIEYYRSIGGAHMHERSDVAFAMSTLDRAPYADVLLTIRPESPDAPIVDVGGGDGRNALPWLEWGYRRVVVVDPVFSALARLRARVAEGRPEWLERLLLVEADAGSLPLVSGAAERVQAIEALYYLNERYEDGLRECLRVLSPTGRILLSERDYEGGLLTSLLHGGVADCLAAAGTRDVWDGIGGMRVRSRSFTARELDAIVEGNGLRVLERRGISAFSLVLGHLRSIGRIDETDETRLDDVRRLLCDLAEHGSMRRCNVVVAERATGENS